MSSRIRQTLSRQRSLNWNIDESEFSPAACTRVSEPADRPARHVTCAIFLRRKQKRRCFPFFSSSPFSAYRRVLRSRNRSPISLGSADFSRILIHVSHLVLRRSCSFSLDCGLSPLEIEESSSTQMTMSLLPCAIPPASY